MVVLRDEAPTPPPPRRPRRWSRQCTRALLQLPLLLPLLALVAWPERHVHVFTCWYREGPRLGAPGTRVYIENVMEGFHDTGWIRSPPALPPLERIYLLPGERTDGYEVRALHRTSDPALLAACLRDLLDG